MKKDISLMLIDKSILFIKTIAYGLSAAVILAPLFAAVMYFPDVSIPFGCGIITGIFCDKQRRDSIREGTKKMLCYIIKDLGIAF